MARHESGVWDRARKTRLPGTLVTNEKFQVRVGLLKKEDRTNVKYFIFQVFL